MTNTQWKKLETSARSKAYSDAIIDALADRNIKPEEAKMFLNPTTPVFGLVLSDFEKTLKDIFQSYCGASFPDAAYEGMEKFAYDAISNLLNSNGEKYGPLFHMHTQNVEILVVSEQAIKALGIDPNTITETIADIEPHHDTVAQPDNAPDAAP